MEGNRDEAEKCRRLAEKFLTQGDQEKAIKFLKKADKLYPTKDVKGEQIWRLNHVADGRVCVRDKNGDDFNFVKMAMKFWFEINFFFTISKHYIGLMYNP